MTGCRRSSRPCTCSRWVLLVRERGPAPIPPSWPSGRASASRADSGAGLPARAADDEAPAVAPRLRAADVGPDRGVLVGGDDERVVGAQLLGQAVDDALALGLEGAEEPVPDDEDAAVVAVEVGVVHAVVHAVVRGRVHDVFHWAPERPDAFGVEEELVEQRDRLLEEDRPDRHAEEGERRPERDAPEGRPRLAQRRREVVALARVVHDVAGPEDAHLVVGAVVPVVREVLGEEDDDPHPPQRGVEAKGRHGIQRGVDDELGCLVEDPDADAPDAHREARDGVADLVADLVVVGREPQRQHLDDDEDDEEGDRRDDDVDHHAPLVIGSRVRPSSVSEAHTSTAWVRIASARRAASAASPVAMASASGACGSRSARSPASSASTMSGQPYAAAAATTLVRADSVARVAASREASTPMQRRISRPSRRIIGSSPSPDRARWASRSRPAVLRTSRTVVPPPWTTRTKPASWRRWR